MPRIAPTNSGVGLQFENLDARLFNRSGAAVVKGDIVQLDLGLDGSGTDNNNFGSPTSGFSSFVDQGDGSGAREQDWALMAVCLEDIGAGVAGRVRFQGIVEAFVASAVTVAVGDRLRPLGTGANDLTSVMATANSIYGVALETTSGSAAELITVLFDGIFAMGKN